MNIVGGVMRAWCRWRLSAALRRASEFRRSVWRLSGPVVAPGRGGYADMLMMQITLEREGEPRAVERARVRRDGQSAAAELLRIAQADSTRWANRLAQYPIKAR